MLILSKYFIQAGEEKKYFPTIQVLVEELNDFLYLAEPFTAGVVSLATKVSEEGESEELASVSLIIKCDVTKAEVVHLDKDGAPIPETSYKVYRYSLNFEINEDGQDDKIKDSLAQQMSDHEDSIVLACPGYEWEWPASELD